MTENDKLLTQIFFSTLFPKEFYRVELSDDNSELLIFNSSYEHLKWCSTRKNLPAFSIGHADPSTKITANVPDDSKEFTCSYLISDPGVWRDNNGNGYPETFDMEELKINRINKGSLLGACKQLGLFIFSENLKLAVQDYEIEKIHLEL